MGIVRDKRQVDLEDYLALPTFLRAENRPPDIQERADARRRELAARQAADKARPARCQVPRLRPRDST